MAPSTACTARPSTKSRSRNPAASRRWRRRANGRDQNDPAPTLGERSHHHHRSNERRIRRHRRALHTRNRDTRKSTAAPNPASKRNQRHQRHPTTPPSAEWRRHKGGKKVQEGQGWPRQAKGDFGASSTADPRLWVSAIQADSWRAPLDGLTQITQQNADICRLSV